MPSMKSTRLRRSGIRKIFRNFSSMIGYPLHSGPMPALESVPLTILLARGLDCRAFGLQLTRYRCYLAAQNHGLAAGLFDLFDRRLGKLVRMNGESRSQLAGAENLDQRLLARGQAQLLVVVQADLGELEALNLLRQTVQIHHRVL